jgi:hypothetical protein
VYGETLVDSKKLNKKRADSRDVIKETGVRTDSYGLACKLASTMSKREADDFIRDLLLCHNVLMASQQELFPEAAIAAAKRDERFQAKLNKEMREAEEQAKKDKRSDPKSGGAGAEHVARTSGKKATAGKGKAAKVAPKGKRAPKSANGNGAHPPTTLEGTASPPNPPGEQEEGAEVLNRVSTPKSQSAVERETRDRLGLN